MKINYLVLAAAVVYGLGGLALVFASRELLGLTGAADTPSVEWIAQIAGGGLLALAWLNWLQRFSIMGGILGRPLLLANLTMNALAFFASIRGWRDGAAQVPMLVAAGVSGALLTGFAMRLFRRAEAG